MLNHNDLLSDATILSMEQAIVEHDRLRRAFCNTSKCIMQWTFTTFLFYTVLLTLFTLSYK